MKPLGSQQLLRACRQAWGQRREEAEVGGDGEVNPPGRPRREEEAAAGWGSVARGVHTWRSSTEVLRGAQL